MALIKGTGLDSKDIRSTFFDAFRDTDTVWELLSTLMQSDRGIEQYRWLGALPTMRRFGTGLVSEGMLTESYDVINELYAIALEIDRTEIADDQTGQIRVRIQQLARRSAQHKDSLVSGLLVNGASAGFVSYDGVPFFDNAHVSGDSGNQTNQTTSVTDDDDEDSFSVAEGKAALKQMIDAMASLLDDKGEPLDITDTGLVILCPPVQFFTWKEVVSVSPIATTGNVFQGMAEVRKMARLGSAKTYLAKTDDFIKPFIFQDREPIEIEEQGPGSDDWVKREKFVVKARARYRLAYADWKMCVEHTWTT